MERAEELYVESKKYLNAIYVRHLQYLKVMDGSLTLDQANDLFIQNNSNPDYDHNRVTMIIDMYFPDLQKTFNEIMKKIMIYIVLYAFLKSNIKMVMLMNQILLLHLKKTSTTFMGRQKYLKLWSLLWQSYNES